ncbi:tetratricopeptide repeat protein [Microcoleus sp. B4-D4]|uniref:tetratricopeptide repeat protein n=1 Tax=Microcoleus sp. B4-D4 TaxID=2818667 RepID=UPI002FD4EA95
METNTTAFVRSNFFINDRCFNIVNRHSCWLLNINAIADRLDADRENSQLVATGYKLVFLAATYQNLGDPEKALILYRQAIARSDQNQYSTIKAKALNGIAALYREWGELDRAVQHHAALEILDRSNKLNRAEACYQLALTEQ